MKNKFIEISDVFQNMKVVIFGEDTAEEKYHAKVKKVEYAMISFFAKVFTILMIIPISIARGITAAIRNLTED